ATSYPNTLRSFLRERGIKSSIIDIRGSVEIAPSLNLADSVCDITQTGNSLIENGLRVIGKIFNSEAVVVKCPNLSRLRWQDFEESLTK
ncbi:ATP phosphoribosyltransferase, partial [Candidatus Peregrinibacteria bacterium]|nr:ATP phosphoribosyltransferase [Candidatus Peregrinibacteria bacterium]